MDDKNRCLAIYGGHSSCLLTGFEMMAKDLKNEDFYFTCNGKIFDIESILDDTLGQDHIIRCHLRVLGGKGGFGSMLRALGAQIEKTTNREACRDLSGRRMRDVNNEKTINEWLEKKKEEEEDKTKKKKEKLDRLLNPPRHILNDSSYVTNLKANAEKVDDALKQGLSIKQQSQATGLGKRHKANEQGGKAKKQRLWLGLSDSDTEEEDVMENAAKNKCSALPVEKVAQAEPSKSNKISDSDHCVPTDNSQDKRQRKEEHAPVNVTRKDSEGSKHSAEQTGQSEEASICLANDDKGKVVDECKLQDNPCVDVPIDLKLYSTAEELEAFGLEKLKFELTKYGLKCGGTLQQRAQRLFLLKDTPIEGLDKSLFAKQTKKCLK